MCTVSFVPTGPQKFILTSNRDETVERGLASAPQRLQLQGINMICPKDPLAHGTWIAVAENDKLTCLLNGAFIKHERHLPYRKSRGIVVLDSLTYASASAFVSGYDFSNIEPFTMVMISSQPVTSLHELRWDGVEKHFKRLNENEFHLWSSVTLYNEEQVKEKERVFRQKLQELKEVNVLSLIDIHKNDFLYEDWVKPPQRVPEVATLSITSVSSTEDKPIMHYRDLVRRELPLTSLKF
ncbi:MAG: NRDE family protein [Chitinophagales bacterium]